MFEAKEVKQNTVSAKDQLPSSSLLQIYDQPDAKVRILFVGNSITYHAPKPEIGWHGSWGMAASCEGNDYVHQTVQMLESHYDTIGFGVAQLAQWELTFDIVRNDWTVPYQNITTLKPDIVVIRMGENIPSDKLALPTIETYIENMIRFFAAGCRQVIVTDCFWKRERLDELLKQICLKNQYTFCQLSDLYENSKTMALGQFEHEGVALHPSDYGMQLIAERIVNSIK